jgi:hypothetical protein
MTDYVDFRLVVSPDLANPGDWTVAIDECPVPALNGQAASLTPVMTRAQLNTLRGRNGWPNVATLRTIGADVWQSVMTPAAAAAFQASLHVAAVANRGLRVVLVLQGENPGLAGVGPGIRLSELPVEAFYTNQMQFVAQDLLTPISRSFQHSPDRDPQRIELPLRVLVAVAAPIDRPPAQVNAEVDVIRRAVAGLDGPGGSIEVDFVEQATRGDVTTRLASKPYHVLHFIGHGGFDIVGDVDAPRAYLCFIRPDGTNRSDPTDADTLTTMLRNATVRLVVITACSSAAPTPPAPNDPADPGPLGTGAFDGVAQRLVTGISPVNAAVGMQFDLEDVAAVEFSKAFYANLVHPGIAIDEVVTLARRALVNVLQAGHRAWITPAVYWRCKEGRIFDIDPSLGRISDAVLAKIHDLEIELEFHRAQLAKIAAKPPPERAALQGFWLESINDVERLVTERADLLGETVRLTAGRAGPGAEIRCRISVRVRRAAKLELVRFRVECPTATASFSVAEQGADAAAPPATAVTPEAVDVVIVDPSGGKSWKAGEYELGFLRLMVAPEAPSSVINLKVSAVQATRGGKRALLRPVDGVLFVERGN